MVGVPPVVHVMTDTVTDVTATQNEDSPVRYLASLARRYLELNADTCRKIIAPSGANTRGRRAIRSSILTLATPNRLRARCERCGLPLHVLYVPPDLSILLLWYGALLVAALLYNMCCREDMQAPASAWYSIFAEEALCAYVISVYAVLMDHLIMFRTVTRSRARPRAYFHVRLSLETFNYAVRTHGASRSARLIQLCQ